MRRSPRLRSKRKDVDALLRAAHEAGARVTQTRNGHFRVMTDEGVAVFASTPSDHRSVLNARAGLRRIGVPAK